MHTSSTRPGRFRQRRRGGLPTRAGSRGWSTEACWSVVDRVLVTSHSIGSVAPGLRTYTIDVRDGANSPWIRVGQVKDAFFERSVEVSFTARPVTDVRLTVGSVNYSGYNGGAPPHWWPLDPVSAGTAGSSWAAPAIVAEVQAISPVMPASSKSSRPHRR
jgi:hypothetical protein